MGQHNAQDTQIKQFKTDVLLLSALLTGSVLSTMRIYKRFFKQYKKVTDIPSKVFRKRWLYGRVTAVGDGDNFHFLHTPGGLFGGWGLIRPLPSMGSNNVNETHQPSRFSWFTSVFTTRKKYTSQYFMNLQVPYKNKRNLPTLSVRLCGVDAPERAHFGNKAQPFSDEALVWLSHTLLGRNVWIRPLTVDQYNRCVAKVVYWQHFRWKDISLELIKQGLAVVYEGKSNAEFDGQESVYRFHEHLAKLQKRGLWVQKKLETPGEYKKKR